MRRNLVITISLVVIVILAVTLGLVFGLKGKDDETGRRFEVDYVGNQFLLDGEPFRYVAGSFHYFRAMPGAWAERLRTMRAAGLNAVDTYVEWSLHNPHDGVYNWEGIADLVKFIELATAEGFYIILRPGPYICAERDNGGVPHWLFTKYPSIRLRTSDPNYLKEVRTWYEKLMPQLGPYMYGNGGNIIMVQVENEYGVFDACDYDYTAWLRDETEKYVQGKALLFTTDIPNERSLKCGKIEGVFATTDFGIDRIYEVDNIWRMLREVQPNGPLVNSEFYPGWLTHWQEENQRRDGQLVADALRTMLQQGASVNFYMFFGGTNFGFTAGANDFGYNKYVPDITSYDYDAVMDEAGAVTPKFNLVRNVITEFFGAPTVQPFTPAKRLAYGQVPLQAIVSMLSTNGRQMLAEGTPKTDTHPLSFEELDQYSGLVLYETTLPALEVDPTLLTIEGLHDRAFVYVDDQFVGTLSRENRIYSLPLHNGWGSNLQLLVENQGRINFNLANDTKGIFGDITVQKLDGSPQLLTNWKTTAFPLDEAKINALVEKVKAEGALDTFKHETILRHGPIVYHGEFTISEVGDTYLNTVGWGKGVLYVNGFNLGRYWPLAGPQLTLYVPNQLLKVGVNTVVMVEYQRANKQQNTDTYVVSMDNEAQLDA